MPKKLPQSAEVLVDVQEEQGSDVVHREPLIQQEDKLTEHDENCAIFTSHGIEPCNCK